MNTGSSFAKKTMEGKVKSEEKCKAFVDICKYFSEEQWAKLGNSEKITHVYMKRNYDTMTQLGLRAHLPDFMRPKKQTKKSPEHDSDEDQNPGNQEFHSTSGISMDFGDFIHQRTMLDHPRFTEHPQETSKVQPRKHLKVSFKSEGPQSLSPCICEYGSGKGKTNVWLHRLRERRNPVVYEEISDPEEDDCGCDKCP